MRHVVVPGYVCLKNIPAKTLKDFTSRKQRNKTVASRDAWCLLERFDVALLPQRASCAASCASWEAPTRIREFIRSTDFTGNVA